MLNWRILLVLSCCVGLLLAPALAEARAGMSYGGRAPSFGSRGDRSWEYNGAQPLNRSAARPPTNPPGVAPGNPAWGFGGSPLQRHPFLTGLAGGLFGSWLFGHAASAAGAGGRAGSMLGTLIWLAVIGWLVWFALRRVRAGAFARRWPAQGPPVTGWSPASTEVPAQRFRGRDVNLADADLNAFQELHAAVQQAWSAGDLAQLRRLTTPEMLGYFQDELARNQNRGVRNLVSNVQLLKAELSEAWEEGERQYATAYLRWRAIDYVVSCDASPGGERAIVGGDPRLPTTAEEVWTFVRRRGGDWLLSAIQQV